MTAPSTSAVLDRHLLLQLGDRLKRLRKSQGLGTVEMSARVGLARNTLRAIESGDPGPSMGAYVRVMSALGVSGELALLAGDTLQPAPAGSAAAQSRRPRPAVQVVVTVDDARHEIQDLQSMALHRAAVDLVKAQPALLCQAQDTLQRWLTSGSSRSISLWHEWEAILQRCAWRKVLGRTRHAQELRQASPLVTVLPDALRRNILEQVNSLKEGVVLGDDAPKKVLP